MSCQQLIKKFDEFTPNNFEIFYQLFSLSCHLNSISYFFDELVMDRNDATCFVHTSARFSFLAKTNDVL